MMWLIGLFIEFFWFKVVGVFFVIVIGEWMIGVLVSVIIKLRVSIFIGFGFSRKIIWICSIGN